MPGREEGEALQRLRLASTRRPVPVQAQGDEGQHRAAPRARRRSASPARRRASSVAAAAACASARAWRAADGEERGHRQCEERDDDEGDRHGASVAGSATR